jgi:hypothetical protein
MTAKYFYKREQEDSMIQHKNKDKSATVVAMFLVWAIFFVIASPFAHAAYTADQSFDVTISVNSNQLSGKQLKNNAVIFLEYDITALEFVSVSAANGSNWATGFSSYQLREGTGAGIGSESPTDTSGYRFTVAAGTIDTTAEDMEILNIQFSVKDEAVDGKYTIKCYASSGGIGAGYGWITVTPTMVEIGDGGGSSAQYTVTATGDTSAEVGDTFDVDINLSASPAVTDWKSLETYLKYDETYVTPGTLPINITGETGNVLVTKVNDEIKLFISRTGNATSVDEDGIPVVSIPFTATGPGSAEFSIENAGVSLASEQVMTDAAPGAAHTVIITPGEIAPNVTFDEGYAGAPDGFKLLRYALPARPSVVYTYNEAPMHYAHIGDSHYVTYIVAADVSAEDAEALVTSTSTGATDFNGDLNGDGSLEIVDAQIAYDIATGVHDDTDIETLTITQRLNADFNADGAVTAEDAYAIQAKLHEAA